MHYTDIELARTFDCYMILKQFQNSTHSAGVCMVYNCFCIINVQSQ